MEVNQTDESCMNCFMKYIFCAIRNGSCISFWNANWLGQQSLASKFPDLFHVAVNQGGSIKEMWEWLDNEWCWVIDWKEDLSPEFDFIMGRIIESVG